VRKSIAAQRRLNGIRPSFRSSQLAVIMPLHQNNQFGWEGPENDNSIASQNNSHLFGGGPQPDVDYSDLSNASYRVPNMGHNVMPSPNNDCLHTSGGAAGTSPLIGSKTSTENLGERRSRPISPMSFPAFLQREKRLYGDQYDSGASGGVPAGNSGPACLDNSFQEIDCAGVMGSTPRVAGTCGCPTKSDIYTPWISPPSLLLLTLSIYSTAFSGVYLFTAIVQPKWGQRISSGHASLGTISTLVAFFAKTIELSFVAVFIGFLGQVISRRSLVKTSRGVTISEICMRSWVLQPGFMIAHWETVKYAGLTFLGILSLVTTVSAMLYTTASDALVSPKLKYGSWEDRVMQGLVQTSYANSTFVSMNCKTPITTYQDSEFSASTCLQIESAGQGKQYSSLRLFQYRWTVYA
jgi:hypothetical protein